MAIPKPKWFSDTHVMISTAPTCGLTKGGRTLRKIDATTGKRVQVEDCDTGELVDAVDDQLLRDMEALAQAEDVASSGGSLTDTLSFVPSEKVGLLCAVPIYYDHRFTRDFHDALKGPEFKGFSSATLAQLVNSGQLVD